MGCFSWMCYESDEPIASDSFMGEQVILFLLKEGQVLEYMSGNYNSYGSVFSDVNLENSFEWNMPWHLVCELMFDDNRQNGIAAVKIKYWTGSLPEWRSEDDPDQGWHEFTDLVYPNPEHVILVPYSNNTISGATISDNLITQEKILNNAITQVKIIESTYEI